MLVVKTGKKLHYLGLLRADGETRTPDPFITSSLAKAQVVHPGQDLVNVCAELRARCTAVGHALAQKDHNADLWIAATAIRLGISLASNDGIFKAVPGLNLETADH